MKINVNPDPTYPKPPAPVGSAAHEIDPDLGRAIGHLSAALGHPTVYGKTGPYGLITATVELAAQRLAAAQADAVTLVGVKADGTEHVLGTATMPPKMKARELVREMFGSIDEETGDDGAMALWVCEQLIEWLEKVPRTVTIASPAEQKGGA